MRKKTNRDYLFFTWGYLEDGTIWIQPPSNNIFRVDQLTLRAMTDWNDGMTPEKICAKYDLSAEDFQSALQRFQSQGAIARERPGGITFEKSREDISLGPYWLVLCLLIYAQAEYFSCMAKTYLLRTTAEGIWVALAALGVIAFHELGHYAAARKYFRKKPRMGFTFSFIFPAIYVDTHEAWCLPRNQRLLINSAGLFGDFVVNIAAIAVAVNWPAMEYYVTPFLLTQYTRLSLILNPLFASDGYWMLSDCLGTVNLKKVAMENLNKLRINWYSLYGIMVVAFSAFATAGLTWFLFNLLHRAARGIKIPL